MLSFIPGIIIKDYNEVVILMSITMVLVVLLSSVLIVAYYKWLYPNVDMFPLTPATKDEPETDDDVLLRKLIQTWSSARPLHRP